MINFSKTTWLTVFLVIFVILVGFFAFQWWQAKGELVKQIKENENLTKQIEELQKEIEELKISKEEKITGEGVAEWETYRNEKQGFEIKFPPLGKWYYNVRVDKNNELEKRAYFDGDFNMSEKGNDISLNIKINISIWPLPLLALGWPTIPLPATCTKEQEVKLLSNQVSKVIIYSSATSEAKGAKEEECDKFLSDAHAMEIKFCVNKNLEVYFPILLEGWIDPVYECKEEDSLYYFLFSCKGEKWQGKEGRDKCSRLLEQILPTFKLI